MSEIQLFKFKNQEVRTLLIENEPYFVGKEVADILGYSNTRDALSKHVDDEDKNTVAIHDGIGNPNKVIINESGLYSLILSSKLPQAKEFKRWVTKEVLPAIHRTGSYHSDVIPRGFESMTPASQMLAVLNAQQEAMLETNQRVAAIEEEMNSTRYLHPGELKALKSAVQSQVHSLIKADGFNSNYSEVSKYYFKLVGRALLDYFGVPNRQMILQKDFKEAMDFVVTIRSTPAVRAKAERAVMNCNETSVCEY